MIRQRVKGFSLIEMIVVIGILAILFSIGAPDFFKTKRKQVFHTQSRLLFETIADARTNAMAGKECTGDIASKYWQVVITRPSTLPGALEYQLQCDTTLVMALPDSDIDDAAVQIKELNGTGDVTIKFLNESAQVVIEDAGTPPETVNIKLYHPESLSEDTVCINRAAGFPEFNQTCS